MNALLEFSNNESGTLTQAISDTGTTLLVSPTLGSGFGLFTIDDGSDGFVGQLITLSSPTNPLPEICRLVSRPYYSGVDDAYVVEVERAVEAIPSIGAGAAQSFTWPIGTLVDARVTAGTISRMPQNVEGTVFMEAPSDGYTTRPFQFGVKPTLMRHTAVSINGYDKYPGIACEVFMRSRFVDLGTPAAWSSSMYYRSGDVVVDGSFQWGFESSVRGGLLTNASVNPLDGQVDPVVVPGVGVWYLTDLTGAEMDAPSIITEVGFVCIAHGAGSTPTVTIGNQSNPTAYANAVALNQITGARCSHRIPVTTGGPEHEIISFNVDTASSDEFRGYFYCRGLFYE